MTGTSTAFKLSYDAGCTARGLRVMPKRPRNLGPTESTSGVR